jgi:hypothetical protein
MRDTIERDAANESVERVPFGEMLSFAVSGYCRIETRRCIPSHSSRHRFAQSALLGNGFA